MKNADDKVMEILAKGSLKMSRKVLLATDSATAILLAGLVAKQECYKKNNMLTKEGAFPYSVESIEKDICIKYKKQRTRIDKLKKLGFISTFLRGAPPIQHFIVNVKAIEDFICSKS